MINKLAFVCIFLFVVCFNRFSNFYNDNNHYLFDKNWVDTSVEDFRTTFSIYHFTTSKTDDSYLGLNRKGCVAKSVFEYFRYKVDKSVIQFTWLVADGLYDSSKFSIVRENYKNFDLKLIIEADPRYNHQRHFYYSHEHER